MKRTRPPTGGLAQMQAGARSGLYRRQGTHCRVCGLCFVYGQAYSRLAHGRPFVAGRAMRWDDDLDLEVLITGEPVEVRECFRQWCAAA